ncbi:hypothetical protein DVH24_027982 [Malus domestica]|uniref:Uncharacterized protein n=1 Tax=Malus domestica TaxID=3750 RepID=A0A498HEF7_MALDO|nr:hypothetical protein DVH24_027982 [Malus domestica]
MAQGVSETMEQTEQGVSETEEQMEQGFGYSQCKPFFEAVQAGRWETTKDFPIKHPEAVRVTHPASGKTALHIAVEAGHVDIVKELVRLMEVDDLGIKATTDHRTALATAAIKGITKMAECMVPKNKELLSIPDGHDMLPIELAYLYGHWHMAQFLYSKTPLEDLMPDKGPHGAIIICNCFASKEFGIDIKPPPCINHISVTVQDDGRSSICSGLTNFFSIAAGGLMEQLASHSEKLRERLVSKIVEIPGINRIYEMKFVHVHSLEFLKFMCEEIKKDLDMKQVSYGTLRSAIFQAVRKGNVEFITHICKANPVLLWSRDDESRGIFDVAIQCRQEKIYNLIYGISSKEVIHGGDKNNNNKLHMAGLLSPSAQAQLNRIPGAALQMQRELQCEHLLSNFVADLLSPFSLDDSRKNGATTVGTEDEFCPANCARTSLIAQASIGGSWYSISSTDT